MTFDVFDLRDRLERAGHRNQVVLPDPDWTPWAHVRPLTTRLEKATKVETFWAAWGVDVERDCPLTGQPHVRVENDPQCIWCGRK